MKTKLLLLGVMLLAVITPTQAAAGTNDFTISRFQIDYYLSKDTEGRSTLKTVETITAQFPAIDQNHGIERAIPTLYDGHSTSLKIASVTDASGKAENYTTYDSNNNTVVRIGDADRYVHGSHTYKLTYTQRDVTKFFQDSNADELYWDTNGTDWHVPITALDVRLHLGPALASALTGKQQCYYGSSGANTPCRITQNQNTFTAYAINVRPGENMTLAIGFQPQTFANYQKSFGERLADFWAIALVATFPLGVVLTIWFSIRYWRQSNRTKELGVIVPEYLPPPHVSLSTAARLVHATGRTFSAQLIDLAVRHYIKIYQTREKSLFRQANYELEITKDISKLSAEERELITDIFPRTTVGTRLDMSNLKRNRKISTNLSDNQKKLDKDIAGKYALRAPNKAQSGWFKRAALIVGVIALLTLSPWLIAAAILALVFGFTLKPLTTSGLELVRYLKGLEMYIKVAEQQRLQMLQSPDGAAKIGSPVDIHDTRQLVKLYERVLPYAILFNQEKDWNKQLGHYYESLHESPSWYNGHNAAFNAVVFSSAMGSFNQVAAYSDPTSASSGGSSGGGFSGGGGGGGGGGGW